MSAYARAGAHCRHNVNYWDVLATMWVSAPGAHGKFDRRRRKARAAHSQAEAAAHLSGAIATAEAAIGERKQVPRAEIAFEFMLNALRLNGGFDSQMFNAHTGLEIASLAAPLALAEDEIY